VTVAAELWVLTFRIDGTEHGLPVADVLEVVRMVALTPLPDGAPWLRGAVNYRGRLLPVVGGRERLGLPARAVTLDMPIVMVSSGDSSAGLIVDEALDVVRLARGDQAGRGGIVAGLVGAGGRTVVLLHAAAICAEAVPV
jgi:purine-binding chemotaxis protein CheW